MDRNRFFPHSAQRRTSASQLGRGAYTEHVQLTMMMARIYENTTLLGVRLVSLYSVGIYQVTMNDTRV